MVNKPLIRPYSWGGVALGGVARIPMELLLKATSQNILPLVRALEFHDSIIDLPQKLAWYRTFRAPERPLFQEFGDW